MNRITPQEVIEAYKKLDIEPIKQDYFSYNMFHKYRPCACPALVYTMAKSATPFSAHSTDDAEPIKYIMKYSGLAPAYINGFIEGVDSPSDVNGLEIIDPIFAAGLTDGVLVNQALKELYPKF